MEELSHVELTAEDYRTIAADIEKQQKMVTIQQGARGRRRCFE
jgi:hypothetical protein